MRVGFHPDKAREQEAATPVASEGASADYVESVVAEAIASTLDGL